ncbi:MAG: response regulator [Planctomycetota bacterium]
MTAKRILFVDDESALRSAIAECLTLEGHAVVEAANVNDAEAAFFEQRFDVVIADLRLPDGCGLDLLTRLRAVDTQFAAIITTGFGTYSQALEAIRIRVAAFLSKPFSPAELLRIINEAPAAPLPADANVRKFSTRATQTGMDILTGQVENEMSRIQVQPWVAARALSLACEALQNAVDHAFPEQPGRIEVETSRQDGSFILQIRDDGCGFEVSAAIAEALRNAPPHHHLYTNHARMSGLLKFHLDADEVRLDSEPGRGTNIKLRFRHAFDESADLQLEMSDDDLAVACLWS